jgi:hypothetical protein
MVTPWVGYVAPARPVDTHPYVPPTQWHQCRDYVFIGARGSGEGPQGDWGAFDEDERQAAFDADSAKGVGSNVFDSYWGFTHSNYFVAESDVTLLPLQYRALGVAYNPVDFGIGGYFDSIYGGISMLKDMLRSEKQHCGTSQKVILSGYSQGALVIHAALRELAQEEPTLLDSGFLQAIILIADPAKVANGAELTWEDANEIEAGSGVMHAEGIWTQNIGPFKPEMSGPLPSQVTGQTIAICHNHDVVCFGWAPLSRARYHLNYVPDETNRLGKWAVEHARSLN